MSERRPPDDLLNALLEYEHDDPAQKPIAELSVAARDAALREAGVDPDALRARGAAHAEKALAKLGPHVADAQVPSELVAQPPVGLAIWAWIALAIAVMVVIGRLILPKDSPSPNVPREAPSESPVPSTPAPPKETPADALIATAKNACDHANWAVCKAALDAAHAKDPASDQTPEALDMRDRATRGLTDKAPPHASDKAPH